MNLHVQINAACESRPGHPHPVAGLHASLVAKGGAKEPPSLNKKKVHNFDKKFHYFVQKAIILLQISLKRSTFCPKEPPSRSFWLRAWSVWIVPECGFHVKLYHTAGFICEVLIFVNFARC